MWIQRKYFEDENPDFDRKYFETHLKAAKQNYSDSMREVGMMYLHGAGVEKNIDEGLNWLERSADNGEVEALVDLGDIYSGNHYKFVPKDISKALGFYLKAANENNIVAIKGIISCYEELDESEKIIEWLEKSAELGNIESISRLAKIYREGLDVPIDDMKALEYHIKLVEHYGFETDDWKFVTKIYNRHFKFTDEKILKYYRTTEKLGKFNAMFGIAAELYKTDKFRALKWYKLAANAGDLDAAAAVAYIIEHDGVVSRRVHSENYYKARIWYEKAAEFGDLNAAKNLVIIYRDGYNCYLRNREKSLDWLNKVLKMEGGNENV